MAGAQRDELPSGADDLFGVAPEEFVEKRNALARALKERGDPKGAEKVRQLRKPTLPVWVVNQLARSHPRDVRQLLRSADRLRGAHGAPAARFKQAVEAERDALGKITEHAADILSAAGRDPTESIRARVSSTLQGAASRPELAEALASGTLTEEVEPPGFEALAGVSLPPAREPRTAAKKTRGSSGPPLGAALDEARARARALDRDARRAEAEAKQKRVHADRAKHEVERLEKRRADAQQSRQEARPD